MTDGRHAALPGLNILVVDDDVSSLEALAGLLTRDGHRICTASRGSQAIRLARELLRSRTPPELSILDFNMPDRNGVEVFQELLVEIPGLGGIFISGDTSQSLEIEVRSAGGFALVRKPLDIDLLRGTISEFAWQSHRRSSWVRGGNEGPSGVC